MNGSSVGAGMALLIILGGTAYFFLQFFWFITLIAAARDSELRNKPSWLILILLGNWIGALLFHLGSKSDRLAKGSELPIVTTSQSMMDVLRNEKSSDDRFRPK